MCRYRTYCGAATWHQRDLSRIHFTEKCQCNEKNIHPKYFFNKYFPATPKRGCYTHSPKLPCAPQRCKYQSISSNFNLGIIMQTENKPVIVSLLKASTVVSKFSQKNLPQQASPAVTADCAGNGNQQGCGSVCVSWY